MTDFIQASDKLHLKQSLVANACSAGIPGAGELFSGTVITGTESQHILYNTTTGRMYYTANGAAAGGFTLFATLDNNPGLTSTDIQLVGSICGLLLPFTTKGAGGPLRSSSASHRQILRHRSANPSLSKGMAAYLTSPPRSTYGSRRTTERMHDFEKEQTLDCHHELAVQTTATH